MKIFTSLLLAIIMLSSCFTFVGCIDLSDDIKMKEAYLRQFGIKDVKAEDVVIDYDAGTYNGARVVMLDAEWHDTAPKKIEIDGVKYTDHNTKEWSEIIDGIEFHYYDTNRLRVYKYGIFFTLKQAKILGLVSDENIENIAIEFEENVNHFRDTCDVFDFPEPFWFEDYDGITVDEGFYDDEIIVEIDSRISRGGTQIDGTSRVDLIEYIGSKQITSMKRTLNYSYSSDYFYVKLKEGGEENIQMLVEYLSNIPGVLSAAYSVKVGGRPEQATNGDYENSDL